MYDEDLAFVHDAGFTDLAEAAARMVLDVAGAAGGGPRLAVDLGCGGGSLAEALAEAGWDVVGFDVSPAMVALARRRVPGGRFEVRDVLHVPLPPCDAVAAVGEVLNHACAARGVDALDAFFRRVRRALRPGGLLLFDAATPGRAAEGPTHAHREGRGWRVEAVAEEGEGMLVRTIDTWRAVGGAERHHREVHRLRLLDPGDVLRRLGEAGFVAERLGGYDDYGFQPGWDGFLARSPA